MEPKFFHNKFTKFEFLATLHSELDLNTSLQLPRFWFSDGTKEFRTVGINEFCEVFNTRFDTNLCEKHSCHANGRFTLFFKDEIQDSTVVVESAVEDITDESPSDVVVEDTEPTEVITEVPADVPTEPDWIWIASLKNNAGDKIKLEQHGLLFNVDLKRNKALKNMIADLRAAVQ